MPEPPSTPALSRRGVLATAAGGLGALLALRGRPATAQVPIDPDDGTDRAHFLFVQNAERGEFTPNRARKGLYRLTLHGVQPHTIYFSDRPTRDAGLAPMRPFLKGLGFSPTNPPNAAVVVAGADGGEDTLVLELFSPRYHAKRRRLTYDARILPDDRRPDGLAVFSGRQRDARLPRRFGEASVFIDDCPDGGVHCTGGYLAPQGVYIGPYSTVPCCWKWLPPLGPGCVYCGSEGDAYFKQLCEENVAGCVSDCNGVPNCLGL
ncbi:MAG TPA: hypothetical protein VNZ62_21980 [Capillimicrobium sp.]|nr:hypothetical protein [Capillimicrobium sp.]